ncbi:hypothetical protein EON64_02970 [archaeon]|nr:MAG: hypothetical protein EON64_02970 [archaeon]
MFSACSQSSRPSPPPSSSSRPATHSKKREREMDKFLDEIRERQLTEAQQPQAPATDNSSEKGSYDDGSHTTNIYIGYERMSVCAWVCV